MNKRCAWLLGVVGRVLPVALVACVVGAGCIGRPRNPTATQPSTALDPKLATPEYYLNQPGTAQVSDRDFDVLWNTCEAVARGYLFQIDRRDYRSGVLATQPMVSKQWFELWRKDAGTARDVEEASMGTIRRTIFFQFERNPDGSYTVNPKVLVERQARVDPKYMSNLEDPTMPLTYWYSIRRDTVMEEKVAAAVRRELEKRSPGA